MKMKNEKLIADEKRLESTVAYFEVYPKISKKSQQNLLRERFADLQIRKFATKFQS